MLPTTWASRRRWTSSRVPWQQRRRLPSRPSRSTCINSRSLIECRARNDGTRPYAAAKWIAQQEGPSNDCKNVITIRVLKMLPNVPQDKDSGCTQGEASEIQCAKWKSSQSSRGAVSFRYGRRGSCAGGSRTGFRQHQDRRAPGAGQLSRPRALPSPRRNTAKCAAFSMAASSPSKVFLTARPRPARIAGFRPSRPSRGRDEYPALVYGANCPQTLHTWTGSEQTFIQDWDDGWQSEDMLKLNIWTPEPDRQASRDVLHSRRRLHLRLLLRTALARRRADGAASRCRAGLGQSPPQYPRIPRCLGDRRLRL